ncbi:putative lipid kinase YegS [Aquisphaera giovannonii]|uniref:Putative lipid kinase YegS n=1 Tax=Aquisphaera giovannonii TaxID=406548 RepID=A0A5B9WEG8_9BACT|nr:lipid kinase YegS [Aquisphaera giovannonii]QEH38280.1 putative lipid kinase YegS [Aquisphaera giovannonii]
MVPKSMTFLVVHGKAARREDFREAIHTVRNEGHRIEIRTAEGPDDAFRIARQAAESGVPTVAAGGGAGTINRVLAGVLAAGPGAGSQVAFAAIPLGTTNDLAASCGIPLDPTEALRLAATGQAVPVDVGRVNGRCFLNMTTGGFGAACTPGTPQEAKATLGRAASLLTALPHFDSIRPARGKLSGPGLDWEGEFLALAVGNGRQAGGGHHLCPDALIDDGVLDVLILSHVPSVEIHRQLRTLLHGDPSASSHALVATRVPSFRVESAEPMHINLDGEPVEGTRFEFDVLPGRILMRLPLACTLLVRRAG